AEDAAKALRDVVGEPPQLATPARLDEIGAATRGLERELDPSGPSPFAAALKAAQGAVQELQREVEAGYRGELTEPGRHGRQRWLLPVWRRRPRGAPRGAPRVRRAPGRDGPGDAARTVRDADAEHSGRADGRGARPDAGRGGVGCPGARAPRCHARALPRGGR